VLPAPTFIVAPSTVPSVTSALVAAFPRGTRLKYAVGVMSCTSSPLPVLPPNAPAVVTSTASVSSFVGSAKTGRLAAVGLRFRFLSATRRTASADFYPTVTACHLNAFVHRLRGVTASVALSPLSPLRGPTRRSSGTACRRGRQVPSALRAPAAPHLERYASHGHR